MGKDKKKGKGKAKRGGRRLPMPTAEEAVQRVAKHKLLGGRKGKAVTPRPTGAAARECAGLRGLPGRRS